MDCHELHNIKSKILTPQIWVNVGKITFDQTHFVNYFVFLFDVVEHILSFQCRYAKALVALQTWSFYIL